MPQVAADALLGRANGQIAALRPRALAPARRSTRKAHPEVQKVQAPDRRSSRRRKRSARARSWPACRRSSPSSSSARRSSRGAIDAQKAQAARQSRKGAELEALRKEAESSKNLYEVLLQKLNETDIAASIRNNNVTVVERAMRAHVARCARRRSPPGGDGAPRWAWRSGVGLVLVRDFLDNTIKDPEEIERYLHLDLLAAVPRYDEDRPPLRRPRPTRTCAPPSSSRARTRRGQVVLVTGTAPQEGKTTTLVNLAQAARGLGREDARDRLRPAARPAPQPAGPARASRASPTTSCSTLPLETADPPDADAATCSRSPRGRCRPTRPRSSPARAWRSCWTALRSHFAWVLIDSPPLASVTDALLLARNADCTVLRGAAQQGRQEADQAQRGRAAQGRGRTCWAPS